MIENGAVPSSKFYTAKYDRVFKTIFVDERDYTLMEAILSECLDTDVTIIKYLKVEQNVRNVKEREKVLDILVKAEGRYINLELNTSITKSTRVRNMNYFTSFYSQHTKRGEYYDYKTDFVHIDISFGLGSKYPAKNEYVLVGNNKEDNYVSNFRIVLINVDKLKTLWYDKDEKEIERHRHLMMLDLEGKDLEEISKDDQVANEYRAKVMDLNSDADFIRPFTVEEEKRLLYNTDMKIAREEGIEEGIKKGVEQGALKQQKEMASRMLENGEPIAKIIGYTGLTKKQIEKIKEELN